MCVCVCVCVTWAMTCIRAFLLLLYPPSLSFSPSPFLPPTFSPLSHLSLSPLSLQLEDLYQKRCITVEGSLIKPVLKFEHTGVNALV
jgi:hypothetical protein